MPFYNFELDKKALSNIIADCHLLLGRDETLALLDNLKMIGFWAATKAGLSFGKDDMLVPPPRRRSSARPRRRSKRSTRPTPAASSPRVSAT